MNTDILTAIFVMSLFISITIGIYMADYEYSNIATDEPIILHNDETTIKIYKKIIDRHEYLVNDNNSMIHSFNCICKRR